MSPDENCHVSIDTNDIKNWQKQGERQVCPLFSNDNEQVSLQRLLAGDVLFATEIIGGAELLVIEGSLIYKQQVYKQDGWIRLPVGTQAQIEAGEDGVIIYLKTGHLAQFSQ